MEPKHIFFNVLKLDDEHKFLLKFEENDIAQQVHFSRNKKHFITNLKAYVRMEKNMTK